MASNTAINPTITHWLHYPAAIVLARLNQTRPATQAPITALEVHVLMTQSLSQVLLVKASKSTTRTFPSCTVVADDKRSFIDVVLDIFQNAIEERTLPDLQFLDFARRGPVMEMVASGRVCVRLAVSTKVGPEHIGETVRLRNIDEMVECRWVDVEGMQHVPGKKSKGLSPGLMERARASLAGLEAEYTRLHQLGGPILRDLYINAIRAAVEIKQIELGDEIITHVLIALDPTSSHPDVLHLIPADEELTTEISRDELFEMQSAVAVEGGTFQMKRWWIVGVVVAGDGYKLREHFVRREMLRGGCRLRVEWVQRTAAQRFVKLTQLPAMARPEGLSGVGEDGSQETVRIDEKVVAAS